MKVRVPLSYLLVLLLAFTGQQVAYARGQIDATGTVTLCLGGGLVAVPLDAEGRPTGPGHICPDATLAVPVDLAPPLPVLYPTVGLAPAEVPYPPLHLATLWRELPQVRAPPFPV